ncbi:hypothetical protein Bca52824_037335 [Brassica carinata]|uniref:NF-X1-type domain-containing protein n=1 Tax=Brassica carinata TaxID=52824 RepID=A0A8X7S4L3_BRACI|nr:hypothetical protein Bca52824_037335 [Brassica carinata]
MSRLPICTADVIERYLLPLLLRKEERSAVRSVSDSTLMGSHVGSRWRKSLLLRRLKRIFVLMYVSCSVILVRVLLVRRLLHLVAVRSCPCDALRGDRFLSVGSVASFSIVSGTDVKGHATLATVILVRYWLTPHVSVKESGSVVCGDMTVKGELKAEDGVYSCNLICGNGLGCGNHLCSEVCHAGPCGDCELLPSRVKTCYCGKNVPSCSNICLRLLPCGLHTCAEVCHGGDCAPCLVQVNQKCRCESTSRTVECYITSSEFVCVKPCGRKKNCGRHRYTHLCQLPCGKNLRCLQHSCESLCHSGHCPPCFDVIFTDLTCACGKASIPPPLPCGTPVPTCHLPCSIPQPCGHSLLMDAISRLPSLFARWKKCVVGHVVLRNIPCGLRDIRCNKTCGKTRRCGTHACARTCHQEPCDAYNESEAEEIAGTLAALCHPSQSCPDSRCEFPVTITCSCGRITATVPCDAGSNLRVESLYEASVLQKLPTTLQPVESSGNRIPLGQRKLLCDDECAKLERKRVDITPLNLDYVHFSENSAMTEIISDIYRRDPKWVLAVEERFKLLVLGKARGASSVLKAHVFCPMQKDKRDTVRLLAERWKLAVKNAGWEPKRFTVVHVTQKSKPPTRIIGGRGGVTVSLGGPHPPCFDPLVDMDPRLVVSLLDSTSLMVTDQQAYHFVNRYIRRMFFVLS